MDGLGGPVGGLTGLIHGLFFFLFFYLINRGGYLNRLGKATINRDLSIEAVRKTASVNTICLPQLNFSVVVNNSIIMLRIEAQQKR
jgi:hypothetical protein